MYKVGICGHFAEGLNILNGQTVKTRILKEELLNQLGASEIIPVDTRGWKEKPIRLFYKCFSLIKSCQNIIILPAHNGVKIFVPMFLFLNMIFHRKLHYVVIGGWLPELARSNEKLKKGLAKFNGIYVETYSMINQLTELGIENVYYLPNFKRLNILSEDELVYPEGEPYKLCTFSRVMKEKGIEDAIEAVKQVNNQLDRVVYELDIYGQIEPDYKERFEKLQNEFPIYINYGGLIPFDKSVETIKNYFALLFPTYYDGEGFAGTILDAFTSGVPVIATDWKYNSEIIENKKTGILYGYKEPEKLNEILFEISNNPKVIEDMKVECLKEAGKYSPDIVMGILTDKFLKYL